MDYRFKHNRQINKAFIRELRKNIIKTSQQVKILKQNRKSPNYRNLKKICSSKNISKSEKAVQQERKKIIEKNMFNKGFITRIQKEFLTISLKTQPNVEMNKSLKQAPNKRGYPSD